MGHKETEPVALERDAPVTLLEIKDIIAQAVGQIRTEFRYMKEEVDKALGALETRFDVKLTAISQKIDAIEVTQVELNRKMETIRSQVLERVATVGNFEREFGKCQEACIKLKEDSRWLHTILENVDNRA